MFGRVNFLEFACLVETIWKTNLMIRGCLEEENIAGISKTKERKEALERIRLERERERILVR